MSFIGALIYLLSLLWLLSGLVFISGLGLTLLDMLFILVWTLIYGYLSVIADRLS